MTEPPVGGRPIVRRLLAWGPAAVWATALFFLSSMRLTPGLDCFPFADKVGHLVLYGVLGGTLAWGRRKSGEGLPLLPPAVGIAYGASDEWHQSFVPGRTASAADWGTDIVGVTVGYWITLSLLGRIDRMAHGAGRTGAGSETAHRHG